MLLSIPRLNPERYARFDFVSPLMNRRKIKMTSKWVILRGAPCTWHGNNLCQPLHGPNLSSVPTQLQKDESQLPTGEVELAQRGSDSKDEPGTPYNIMDEKDEIPTKIPATGGFLTTPACVLVSSSSSSLPLFLSTS